MGLSQAAIDALPLGKDVYDDLTYCTSQWQEAAFKAVYALPEPQEPGSRVDWVITLIGNLAWAATVFFPPSAVVATAATVVKGGRTVTQAVGPASAATKAVSMIGATLAAGVVTELRKLGGKLNSPDGKAFLNRYMGSQVPEVLKGFAAEADPWVKTRLRNHLIATWSITEHPDPRNDNDQAFTRFYNSVKGAEERRRHVWNGYVFPDYQTTYDGPSNPSGQQGLQDFIFRDLKAALKDFNAQYQAYMDKISDDRGAYRQIKQEYVGRIPPFDPVLTYKGVPQKFLAIQETNRRALSKELNSTKPLQRK